MNVEDVIRRLGLAPHPEGGHYRETWRAAMTFEVAKLGARAAHTAIYYLLAAGEFSAFHRVASDEIWHFYDGDPIDLHLLDDSGAQSVRLGRDLGAGQAPQVVVPAGTWQAAAVVSGGSEGSLCGCTVAPGFDFVDFEMPSRDALIERYPAHRELVTRWTRPGPGLAR